jgi:hypothetical protein
MKNFGQGGARPKLILTDPPFNILPADHDVLSPGSLSALLPLLTGG